MVFTLATNKKSGTVYVLSIDPNKAWKYSAKFSGEKNDKQAENMPGLSVDCNAIFLPHKQY